MKECEVLNVILQYTYSNDHAEILYPVLGKPEMSPFTIIIIIYEKSGHIQNTF